MPFLISSLLTGFSEPRSPTKTRQNSQKTWKRYERSRKTATTNEASTISFLLFQYSPRNCQVDIGPFYFCSAPWRHAQEAQKHTHGVWVSCENAWSLKVVHVLESVEFVQFTNCLCKKWVGLPRILLDILTESRRLLILIIIIQLYRLHWFSCPTWLRYGVVVIHCILRQLIGFVKNMLLKEREHWNCVYWVQRLFPTSNSVPICTQTRFYHVSYQNEKETTLFCHDI